MRNILEYPVTRDEMLDFLKDIEEDLTDEMNQDMVCGDMRMVILMEIREQLHRLWDLIDK